MIGKRTILFSILYLALLNAGAYAQSISASVDTDEVELGDPISLNVVVTGKGASLPDPELPDLSAFDVYSSGRNSSFSMNFGEFSSTLTLNYTLIPKKIGNTIIGPITIKVKGKEYASEPIKIMVKQQGAIQKQPDANQRRSGRSQSNQRDFFIEQFVDKKNPYIGEQVTLTFRFYQAVNLWGQPSLEWPKYSGITVEDLAQSSPTQKYVDGRLYRITEIRRAVFPIISGDITIDTPRLTISPDDLGGFSDPFGIFDRNPGRRNKPIILTANQIKLKVRPLPTNGRPASFAGGVGRYSIRSVIDKDTVGVDEPITLKVILSGTGDLKSLPPVKMPEFADFRVYESGKNESINQQGGKIAGSRTFEMALIPKTSGKFTIPPLEYSYFNPSIGKYETVRTRQMEIVATGEGLTDVGGAPKNIIEAARQSFGYIITDFPKKHSQFDLYASTWFWLLQTIPLLGIAGALVFRSHYRKLLGDKSYARRVSASRRSRAVLKSAASKKDTGDMIAYAGELHDSVLGFVADRLDLPKSGLTIDDLTKLDSLPEDLKGELISFLEYCQSARFASTVIDNTKANELLESASVLIGKLEKSI